MLTAATYVEKGGVGKTTTTAHLAVAAHQHHDLDVLLIDLAGTQNDLSTQFGVYDEAEQQAAERGVSAVFSDEWSTIADLVDDPVAELSLATGEGPDLIPADEGLAGKDNDLANLPVEQRYDRLHQFLRDHAADRYDLVLLDLPGKEDNIALSGLYAAEDIIAPLRPGEFERQQLSRLEADLADFGSGQDRDTRLSLVVPTMIDGTTSQAESFLKDVREMFDERVGAPIAESQDISNYQAVGRTLLDVDENELYQTGQRARESYVNNTQKLLETLQ